MSELISGKEALIALANGQEIELQATGDMNWYNSTQWTVGELLCFKGRFRLKPKTITINGIEVPAPFEPNSGEDFYYLDCTSDNYGGWAKTSWRNVESDAFKNNTVFGAWRTEEEIKQVVSALRSVFKGGV